MQPKLDFIMSLISGAAEDIAANELFHRALPQLDLAMAELRELAVQDNRVWRCTKAIPDDGGYWTDKKYAKSEVDMLIYADDGYHCVLLPVGETV